MKYHLAQVNIATAIDDMDSETMSGFVSRLDEINLLADEFEGFVWRLQTEEGDSTSIRVFENPNLLINISVWESVEALKQFIYKSAHVELIQDRDAWFTKMKESHQTLWWVPTGHIPTTEEAKEKLEYMREHGPTAKAFTFAKPFESTE